MPPVTTSRPSYPPSPQGPVVDDYHGTRVPDPYRWLEDANDPATVAWGDAQNALTRTLLDGPARDRLAARLRRAYDFPRVGIPVHRRGRYFFTRNSGLQDQALLFVQDGIDGTPRVLLDPNTLSGDGTVALTAWAPSDDGRRLAYARSERGSDWQEIHVRDVATGVDRPDAVCWAKFTSLAWTADGTGFYYTRFPAPGEVAPGDEQYFSRLCFHRLGDPQSADRLIADRPSDRDVVFGAAVTHDGRYLVVSAFRGASDDSEMFLLDLHQPGAALRPLFTGFAAAYIPADTLGHEIVFRTTDGAPFGRIIAVDPETCGRPLEKGTSARVLFREVVAETRDTLSAVHVAGGRVVARYLRDAADRLVVFERDGRPGGEIPLPALGSVSAIESEPDRDELFFGFSSFAWPPTVFRAGVASGARMPFGEMASTIDPGAHETRQVWYASKDGTRISMFLVHRKGLAPDGNHPVYLTGYGGFNISRTPAFDPGLLPWLEDGGVLALPQLRGGGEYGDAWHRAGMLDRKQNVFDDFIAAAEWLIAGGWTRPSRLAIEGGSNGGLLVGAVEVQRPDLFGAVICRVPVVDMLRYHRFTVGRFWIPEYGSADDPEQFAFLHRYSPLHNVRDEVAYPPTLVMTADTDDRVAPGMAKKFAARLQAATAGGGPILIRVETKAGHGGGKPVSKLIDEDADILRFLELTRVAGGLQASRQREG